VDQVRIYHGTEGQLPSDLWHDLLLDLNIDEDTIGPWTIDRRMVRDWNADVTGVPAGASCDDCSAAVKLGDQND
jgi:hypothetical protein